MRKRVNTLSLLERIGAHTHIRGLGVEGAQEDSGVVGQISARKALHTLIQLSKINRGRMVLLTGPSGGGKSALLEGMKRDLRKEDISCTEINASQIFSSSLSKTEILIQTIRKSIGMRMQEKSAVIEGEVVQVQIDRENAAAGKITLKTTDEEGVYTLGEKMIKSLYEERVEVGDIVKINKTTCTVKKRGKSLSRAKDHEAIGPHSTYIPTPEGELLTERKESHTVSFHEIDVINSKNQGYLSLLTASSEIPAETRESVDASMKEWVEENKGVLVTGVVIINESHLMDMECYSFLNTISEMKTSPILILCTSKESSILKETGERAKHGMPEDFASRTLTIQLQEYTEEEKEEIVRRRIEEENTQMEEVAIQALISAAKTEGFRYAFNLLSAADSLRSKTSAQITEESISFLKQLFPSEKEILASIQE